MSTLLRNHIQQVPIKNVRHSGWAFQSSRMQFWTAELLWAELRHSKFIFVETLTNSQYLRKTVFEERAFKEMSKLK